MCRYWYGWVPLILGLLIGIILVFMGINTPTSLNEEGAGVATASPLPMATPVSPVATATAGPGVPTGAGGATIIIITMIIVALAAVVGFLLFRRRTAQG